MTRITLLRHSKSSWNESNLEDRERPLNARGEKDAPLMGRICAEKMPKPDHIVSSPAIRVQQTLNLFIHSWRGLSDPQHTVDERLYHAGVIDWVECASDYFMSGEHLLMCGHLPGVELFAQWLDSDFSMEVPTSTVMSFIINNDYFSSASGHLQFYAIPRDYYQDPV